MTEVERLGKAVARARAGERKAMEALARAVQAAAGHGEAEADLARQAGVTRTTIRKMLGKDA